MTTIFLAQYRLPYPTYFSGADIANLSFLNELKKRGFTVKTLYCAYTEPLKNMKNLLKKRGFECTISDNILRYTWESVEIEMTSKDDFFSVYNHYIKTEKIDWVWHHNPLFILKNMSPLFETPPDVKHFAYIQSEKALELLDSVKKKLDLIVGNSLFVKNFIKEKWMLNSEIIYPLPDESSYQTNHPKEDRQFITMINPNIAKGGEILFHLIPRFPDKQFLIVPGWVGELSDQWDFSQFKNATIHPVTMDMKSIYAKTRVLLIPSLCKEFFGRVQFESALNGIPSIISNSGALPEFFLGNGICVKDYFHVSEWEKAINDLDDPNRYKEAVKQCEIMAKKYSLQEEVDKLAKLLS